MTLHMVSHPDVNAEGERPTVVESDGVVTIVPRHLTGESIDLAREYGDYADDPDLQREEDFGGRVGAAVERERMRRWDDYVGSVAPTFTTRADAIAFAVQFVAAIDRTWPQP